MNARYVLDTNVLIYGFDAGAPEKQERALGVLERVGERPSAALPAQVLAEFANVMLRGLDEPLTPGEVHGQIERHEDLFPVLPLTSAVVLEAVRGMRDHSFSCFDAQIWAVARLHQVPVVLSKDFPIGAAVEGVTFANPLAEDFDLGEL